MIVNMVWRSIISIKFWKKTVNELRNESIFEIIQNGGIISKGDLYSKLITLLNLA